MPSASRGRLPTQEQKSLQHCTCSSWNDPPRLLASTTSNLCQWLGFRLSAPCFDCRASWHVVTRLQDSAFALSCFCQSDTFNLGMGCSQKTWQQLLVVMRALAGGFVLAVCSRYSVYVCFSPMHTLGSTYLVAEINSIDTATVTVSGLEARLS